MDSFNMADAGPLRCAINDVVKIAPDCPYCFANDGIRQWRYLYRPSHTLFSPSRTIQDAFLDPAITPDFVSYPDEYDDYRLTWAPERLAREGLAILPGTIGSAIQILFVMGVRKIVCVGIDGGGGWATREKWLTAVRSDQGIDYDRIRNGFIRAAGVLRMKLQFSNQPAPEHAAGVDRTPISMIPENVMTYIEIISGTFLRGSPLAVGQIVSVTPEDAATLISLRRAIKYVPPAEADPVEAPAPVELAAVEPAAEVADAAPVKRAYHRRHPAK